MLSSSLSRQVLDACRHKKIRLVTAESCTGGLLSASLTDISGASDVFDRGYVAYSNTSKTELLKVPAHTIESYGAVSREVALAMAEGALKHSEANLAISITGIAGPQGGSLEKPVGLIFIGIQFKGHAGQVKRFVFSGDRSDIRQKSVEQALQMTLQSIS